MALLPLPSPQTLGALQRILVIALLAPAVVLALLAALPALSVLPFLPNGTERYIRLLGAHTSYLRTLLVNSRPSP
jgi:hypothetical protein